MLTPSTHPGISSTSVYGATGADSIVFSGVTDNGTNIYDAGAGNDTIFFQSAEADTVSGSSIVGGVGNDSILFQSMSAGTLQSGYIGAGAGDDTITITDLQAAGSAGAVGATIKGGAGADLITRVPLVLVRFATRLWLIAQSTLSAMDTLTFNTAAVSAGTTFGSAQILVNLGMGITTGVSGAGAVGQVSASGGFVVFSGYSDNSLTARVSAIDAGYTTTGDYAVFTTDNTTRYLFVQGGTTDLAKLPTMISYQLVLEASFVPVTQSASDSDRRQYSFFVLHADCSLLYFLLLFHLLFVDSSHQQICHHQVKLNFLPTPPLSINAHAVDFGDALSFFEC